MFFQVPLLLIFLLIGFSYSIDAEGFESSFPIWIEKNFEWKNQGKLSETEFIDGINWLINQKILEIPKEPPAVKSSNKILEIKENWKETFATRILQECGTDSHCAVEELRILLNNKAHHNSIMKTYYDLVDFYKRTDFSCHTESHRLSEFLYGYLQNVTLALEYNDPLYCGGANYHGIVYSHIQSQVVLNGIDPSNVDISTICPNDPENEPTISRWECLHGIGHGLTKINNFDVFSAIERCEEFENDWERVSCSKGLFMENVGNYYNTGQGTISKNDLFFPCNQLDQKLSPACYHYQARHVYNQNGYNFKSAFIECEKAPQGFEKYCYRGLGNKMGRNVQSDSDFARICLTAKLNSQEDCFKGIAMKYADNRSIKEALQFCKIIPDEFQGACYEEVGKWIRMVYDKPYERLQACLVSKNLKYFQACIEANFEELRIL